MKSNGAREGPNWARKANDMEPIATPTNTPVNLVSHLQLLTILEVAALLKTSRRKIYRLLSEGKFPLPVRIGHNIRFRPHDIEAYQTQNIR